MISRLPNSNLRRLSLVLVLVAAQLAILALVAASADAVTAARWYLRNSNSAGVSDIAFNYGDWGGTMSPVAGDWDSNGTDTPGMFDTAGGSPANWHLRNFNSAGAANIFREYGLASAKPIVRDWNCEGAQTNVYKDGAWYLRRADGGTQVENFGGSAWVPAIGPWATCTDDLIVFNPSTGQWKYLIDNGLTELTYYYGSPGDIALIGDWDGNGSSEPGVYRPSTSQFHLAYGGESNWTRTRVIFAYGNPGAGWKPVVGDWNGDGVDTIGLVAPTP